MKLKQYLRKNNLTWDDFANLSKVSRQTIYNILRKKHPPTSRTLQKIVAASNGEVTIEDMLKK